MRTTAARKISIYLKIDSNSINAYFNPHDPARLDKRQLGHDFQEYLNNSLAGAGRHTMIDFKVFCCDSGNMRFMVDPLIRTIRRHFQIRKMLKEAEFRKFKKKNYTLLMISILVVMLFSMATTPEAEVQRRLVSDVRHPGIVPTLLHQRQIG